MKKDIKKTRNLNDILDSSTDSEDFQFEEMVVNSDFMNFVSELMKINKIETKAELAEKLGVTKAYVSKLFSGDKYFNVHLLVQLQRIFDVKFQLVTTDILKDLQKKINDAEPRIWVFSPYQKYAIKGEKNVDVTTKAEENWTVKLNGNENCKLEALINCQ
jgi:transcriptional regulator with XRE-family HTH domain